MLALTPTRSAIPSCSRSSQARTSAGAMPTRPMSDDPDEIDGPEPAEPADLGARAELAETPDTYGAYPRLTDSQIASLAALGRRRVVSADETLFREGYRNCDFFVVLAGKIASVEGHGTPGERVISVHGRGRFLGELNVLTGEASYYGAVAMGQ